MEKLISVIVPVYNVEPYLERCLNSIINQTYKNLEIILVDDGSSDNSGAICDNFSQEDKRIKVIHTVNGGVCKARNIGLEIAVGDYISFIDSDDYIEPNMLEILYNNAIKSNSDLSCCGILQKHLDGVVETKYCTGEIFCTEDKNILIEKFFNDPIYKEVLYGPCNKIIKADIAKSVKFNEKYKIGEDLLFSFECLEKIQSFYFENKGLYYYIKREKSATTSKFSIKRFDYIYVADILLEKCKACYKEAYNSALLWTYVHKQNMCYSLCKNSKIKNENLDFFKKCYSFCVENKKHVWKKLSTKNKIRYLILRCAPFLCKLI